MSKLLAPIYLPGQEPMPAGTTPEEREEMQNVQRWQKYATMGMESCPVKVGMSAGAGEFECVIVVRNVSLAWVGSGSLELEDWLSRSTLYTFLYLKLTRTLFGFSFKPPRIRTGRFLLPHVRHFRLRRPPITSFGKARGDQGADDVHLQGDGQEHVEFRERVRQGRSALFGIRMLYRGGEYRNLWACSLSSPLNDFLANNRPPVLPITISPSVCSSEQRTTSTTR
jgi:hypothetical protein